MKRLDCVEFYERYGTNNRPNEFLNAYGDNSDSPPNVRDIVIATAEREQQELSEGMVTALESRAEVESLEGLQQERRDLLPRFAELAAKFKGGNSASADSKRKQHRALVAKRILSTIPATAKEPSEAALERMANSDVEHIAFCETMEREFTEYVLIEYRITEIAERIRNRETCLNVYNAELRLTR